MGLQTRMFLLVAVMFAVLYGVITIVGSVMVSGVRLPILSWLSDLCCCSI